VKEAATRGVKKMGTAARYSVLRFRFRASFGTTRGSLPTIISVVSNFVAIIAKPNAYK